MRAISLVCHWVPSSRWLAIHIGVVMCVLLMSEISRGSKCPNANYIGLCGHLIYMATNWEQGDVNLLAYWTTPRFLKTLVRNLLLLLLGLCR